MGARSSAFDPIAIFASTNLGVAPRSGGEPKEPTVAIGHNVAWYTGNTSVGWSLDGGKTWSTADPSTILPDPPNQGLCCDQQVIYAPSQNLFIWILQYFCPSAVPAGGTAATGRCELINGNNIIRFAVATPEELRTQAAAGTVGKAWHIVLDLTPQQLKEPANTWFDYSTVSVNDWYLNYTVDMLEGKDSAVSIRADLAALAQHRFQANYVFTDFHTTAAQEPPGTTASYFVTSHDFDTTRVYAWAPNSTVPIVHDALHETIPVFNGGITGNDGNNWNQRATDKLGGATLTAAWSHNKLFVANMAFRDQCPANCDSATPTFRHVYDHPAIWLNRIDTVKWRTFSDFTDIWSNSLNYSWPALGVAKSGTIGISFLSSADNANPVPVAGFIDTEDIDAAKQTMQLGDPAAGPQPGVAVPAPGTGTSGGTGDYYSLLPGTEFESFVMPYRSLDPNPLGGFTDDWRFVMYGHGQALAATPPIVNFRAPVAQTTFPQGSPVTFWASVSDTQDIDLPYSAITWSVDGRPTSYRGSVVTMTPPALDGVGDHVVSVTATNGEGLSTTKSITVTLQSTTPTSPTARITLRWTARRSPRPATTRRGTTSTSTSPSTRAIRRASRSLSPGTTLPPRRARPRTWATSHTTPVPLFDCTYMRTNCGQATHKMTVTVSNGTEAATSAVQVTINSAACVR